MLTESEAFDLGKLKKNFYLILRPHECGASYLPLPSLLNRCIKRLILGRVIMASEFGFFVEIYKYKAFGTSGMS